MFFFFPFMMVLFLLCFFLLMLGKYLLKGEFKKNNVGSFYIYECGYMMFDNFEKYYSLQFFLIALSFMFFDLEIVLFMPFIFCFQNNFLITLGAIFFIFFLTIGLFMEFTLKVF
uniref:NADH-ubiquinone oxidoreductase chain 3 n=1 Tax=Diplosoma listerianum TaxID=168635 RepID=D1GL03_9ASCI|nr:NADH dehydrogenase subunit 3 [Diplosoma listerianum]